VSSSAVFIRRLVEEDIIAAMENPGTYFVGRAELLSWINSTLDLNYSKVEQVRNVSLRIQMS
jgi:hypothetical protein